MKTFSTKPTDENALKMFELDGVERNDCIVRFVNLLDAIDGECTIALNGDWGSGKTFFVKQTKLLLDFFNPQSDLEDDVKNRVQQIAQTLRLENVKNYATVYYDAWMNDNAEDPILSLIHETLKDVPVSVPSKRKNLLSIAAALVDAVPFITGKGLTNLLEKAKGEDFLKELKDEEYIRGLVRQFIDELIVERGNRLVFFVDELDRCKPEYAIKLLERIKHYFDDERIIFVFSVNMSQLQHTIRAYYGANFSATRYLDKFFDLRISLPTINYQNYINKCFPFMATSWYSDKICVEVIKHFNFSLRETERYVRLCKIAYNKKLSRNGEKLFSVAHAYFIPIALGMSMRDISAYEQFINGESENILFNILPETSLNKRYAKRLMLQDHEFFSQQECRHDRDVVVNYEERMKAYYRAFFCKNPFPENEKDDYETYEMNSVRRHVNQILSLLSWACDYTLEDC